MTWETMPLGEFLTLKRGYDLPSSKREEGGVPIVSSSGITGYHNVSKVLGPGVVTGRYGTLGEVYFVDRDYWPLNTALYVSDFNGNNPRFAAYFLRNILKGRTSDKTAVPGINRNDLHALRVRVTRDSRVQDSVSSILSTYDDLIENNRRRIQLLEQAARLLYREWFVHLRFPGHEHVTMTDGAPVGWEKGTIADFYATTSGGTPSRKRPEFFEGDINWVKTQELDEGFIFETEERITEDALCRSAAKLFPVGTILVSIYGGANIGRTGILGAPSASNQACVALFPRHPTSNSIFAQLFLQNARESLLSIAQGAAQTNISQQVLRKVSMTMPTSSLMHTFLATARPVYEQLKCLQLQNRALEKSRDILLPRLMNGEVTA